MASCGEIFPRLIQFFKEKQILMLTCFIFTIAMVATIMSGILVGIALLISYFGGIIGFHYIFKCEEPIPNVLFMLKRRTRIVSRSEVPRSCTICGDSRCRRHKADFNVYNLQPWVEIRVPKEVDEALEDFLNATLDKYIYEWYRIITDDEYFVHELRICFRFMVAVLVRRSLKVDLTNLIVDRLIRSGIQHLDCCLQAQRLPGSRKNLEEAVLNYYGPNLHVTMGNRKQEMKYLRHLSHSLLQYIIPKKYLKCKSFCSLVPEILSGSILLSVMDIVSDPHVVNRLLIIFFDKTAMIKYPESTSPWVELLSNFVDSRTPTRSSTLHLPMSRILSNQSLLYPFMQFMKEEAAINVLQFCLAIEDFNRKILDPDLTNVQLVLYQKEAQQIYDTYCSPIAVDRVQLDRANVEEVRKIVYGTPEEIVMLRTSPPLFKCYDQAFRLLEKTFWPMFHQSDSYFTLLCGSRLNDKNGRGSGRSPKKELSAVAKIGSKLTKIKGVFKASTVDGRVCDDDTTDVGESAFVDGTKSDPEVLSIGSEDSELRSKDMSAWRVSIPKIDNMLEDGYKFYYVYVIEIQSIDFNSHDDPGAQHWQVERRYHEFYALEAKLIEFHGDLEDAHLPQKRSHSGKGFDFMEARRRHFEDFLQTLLTTPNLRKSELLRRFLTPGPEFTTALFPDINLGRMIKTMPMKLLKEKGQHLDPFLQCFVQSTEPAKPRPSKLEQCDASEAPEQLFNQRLMSTEYGNNANRVEDSRVCDSGRPRLEIQLEGIYDYIVYLGIRVFDIPSWVLYILMSIRSTVQRSFESFMNWYIDTKLEQALIPQRLVQLLRLLKEAVFDDETHVPNELEKLHTADKALEGFRSSFVEVVIHGMGKEKFNDGTRTLFSFLQHPRLNKQLSYVLLDIIVTELFPELAWPTRASFTEK